MSPVFQYKRVVAENGKHGAGDFRMSISGVAPTHGEMLALLAGILKAERRYEGPRNNLGAYLLWTYIDTAEPLFAKTWDAITKLATDADTKREKDAA